MINYKDELTKALPQIIFLVNGSSVVPVKRLILKTMQTNNFTTSEQAIEYMYNSYLAAKKNSHYVFSTHLNLLIDKLLQKGI